MKKRSRKQLVSVVIPCYKIPRSVVKNILYIKEILEDLDYKYEIVAVVDGTEVDKTYENALKINDTRIKILGYTKNRGKGYAVRYGMERSNGDIVFYIDSDLDINPNGISMLLAHYNWYNADIIVGSKLHPVSKIKYPFWRVVLSFGYRTLVRLLFRLKIRDTQVGLKVFKRQVLTKVLPKLTIDDQKPLESILEAPLKSNSTGASYIL